MKIGIVGKGCIGKRFAHGLKQSNIYHPHLLLKSSTINLLKKDNIIESNICNITYHPMENDKPMLKSSNIPIIPIDFDNNNSNIFDIIVVPIKSFQIITAIKYLEYNNFLINNPMVILLNNGIVSEYDITECINPNTPVVFGMTANGTMMNENDDPFTVRSAGHGITSLGFRPNLKHKINTKLLCDVFNSSFDPTSWFDDIEPHLLLKLAVNCCVNPLTAIYQVTNGSVIQNSKHEHNMKMICKELINVYQAYCDDLNIINVENETHEIWEKLCNFDSVWNFICSVCNKTGSNYSSMNRDIYFKRKTEIDEMNGYIIKLANKYNIDTPINQEFVNIIHELEGKTK